jgi:hypothetical protein
MQHMRDMLPDAAHDGTSTAPQAASVRGLTAGPTKSAGRTAIASELLHRSPCSALVDAPACRSLDRPRRRPRSLVRRGSGFDVSAFAAWRSCRPYQAARPLEDAVSELRRNAGGQFDPRVVEVLCRQVEAGAPLALGR